MDKAKNMLYDFWFEQRQQNTWNNNRNELLTKKTITGIVQELCF